VHIQVCCNTHQYPARIQPLAQAASGARVLDILVHGLVALGHEVSYYVPRGIFAPMPEGARHLTEMTRDCDVVQYQNGDLRHPVVGVESLPWVRTCHTDIGTRGDGRSDRNEATRNWIYVSRTLANTYGSDRAILNGIDPAEYIYSEAKGDYVLFLSDMARATRKGFDIAVELSQRLGFELVFAGDLGPPEREADLRARAAGANARFVGEVWGEGKAELIAGARALLFPTQFNEAFGLVIAEALMSGTPVICSDKGACPELVSPEVGFVCSTMDDYVRAFENVDSISRSTCREKALREFHYLRMAREYVREYEIEIEWNAREIA
jgi:glycosyltransferase involved in cell wall biosynthesis